MDSVLVVSELDLAASDVPLGSVVMACNADTNAPTRPQPLILLHASGAENTDTQSHSYANHIAFYHHNTTSTTSDVVPSHTPDGSLGLIKHAQNQQQLQLGKTTSSNTAGTDNKRSRHRKSKSKRRVLHSVDNNHKQLPEKSCTFNLQPEYFYVECNSDRGMSTAAEPNSTSSGNIEQRDIDHDHAMQIKEQNRANVQRMVTVFAVTLTIICFVLVGLSLAFGNKVDKLNNRHSQESMESSKQDLNNILRPRPSGSTIDTSNISATITVQKYLPKKNSGEKIRK